jgi:hypothetical protein
MKVSLKSVLAAGLAVGALALSASAAPLTISSTVDQSGYVGPQSLPSYPLTGDAVTGLGNPYDFTGQGANTLTTIDSITVTLTSINDGDTGPVDFDRDNLFLGLDGINTGIKLNGLLNDQIVTIQVTGVPSMSSLILAALSDEKLAGSIIDLSPTNGTAGDILGIPRAVQTTLSITGEGFVIPVPAAAVMAPLGAVLAGIYSRRFRRQK